MSRNGLALINGLEDGLARASLTALDKDVDEAALTEIETVLVVDAVDDVGLNGVDELDTALLVVEVLLIVLMGSEVILLGGEIEVEIGINLFGVLQLLPASERFVP